MTRQRIHLICPAATCRPFASLMKARGGEALIAVMQELIGPSFEVTADAKLLTVTERELHAGRRDDRERAEDLQCALANDHVAAIVALRGGAWFARILPRIDFSVMSRRTRPVVVFGFSELTPLINIVGSYENGIGVYALTPGFLMYGLKRYATRHGAPVGMSASDWMRARLNIEVQALLREFVAILERDEAPRTITARHARGRRPDPGHATFVGGNLTVLSTLVGSRYQAAVQPDGRWLLLEDFHDKPERFDRFLAHLSLAGYWERLGGVVLGDFHQDQRDLTETILALLDYHIPEQQSVPVLVTDQIGHVWPASPLPLHRRVSLRRRDTRDFVIQWVPASL